LDIFRSIVLPAPLFSTFSRTIREIFHPLLKTA
jgi:hypothetical protein